MSDLTEGARKLLRGDGQTNWHFEAAKALALTAIAEALEKMVEGTK